MIAQVISPYNKPPAERYISKNAEIQRGCLEIERYQKEESSTSNFYQFPDFTGYQPYDKLIIMSVLSSTGAQLPLDFSPPSHNYDVSYGDITVNIKYPVEGGFSGENGCIPWAIDFGHNDYVQRGYMHNFISPDFVGTQCMQAIMSVFQSCNWESMYPLWATASGGDDGMIAILSISNLDGTSTPWPLECTPIDSIEEAAFTFPQEICMAGMDEDWDLAECYWLLGKKVSGSSEPDPEIHVG